MQSWHLHPRRTQRLPRSSAVVHLSARVVIAFNNRNVQWLVSVSHTNTRCKRDHRARVAELFGWAVGLGENIVPEINVSIANITGVPKLSRVS